MTQQLYNAYHVTSCESDYKRGQIGQFGCCADFRRTQAEERGADGSDSGCLPGCQSTSRNY